MTLEFRMRPDLLQDFERFQLEQSSLSPKVRWLFAVSGATGIAMTGWLLWQEGFFLGLAGFFLISCLFLTMSVRRPTKAPAYRTSLENKPVRVTVDENGIRMFISGRLCSQSRWKKIHGLFETQRCFYVKTGANACYILDRRAAGPDLKPFMEKQARLRFIPCHH